MKLKGLIAGEMLACGSLLLAPSIAAQVGAKEKTAGITVGYIGHNNSAVTGVDFTYRFSRHFRVAPEVLYAFRYHGEDALIINLNVDVPFSIADRVEIYPLAGINFTNWNYHGKVQSEENYDVTTRVSNFGLNVGGGIGVGISPTLRLGLEAQWALVKDFSSAIVLAKIAYVF